MAPTPNTQKNGPSTEFIRVAKKIAHKMSWLSASILVDFFAFLPIPQGDPLDCMVFIVEGNVWTYSTAGENEAGKATPSSMTMATKTLQKGHIYGEELLNWASDNFTELPICRQHDLATVVSRYQLKWNFNKCNIPQEVKEVAASTIVRRFRHNQGLMMSRRLALNYYLKKR
ncbi:hypothetical protein L3X38_015100 [Prunus dulcis]|uniref:Cyclic nucleotide gated channel 1 n=1 Tax=Prunus dulcis TaxID=3755 RepID=A0AAD4WRU9_PRUDU|nr:hypothetical protein L3X38_015100 [Prunus dulcis]